MRLAIGAGFLAAIGLVAFGPASAAYATPELPSPTPSLITEEPSDEASATEMSYETIRTTDDDVTIKFEPLDTFEHLTVTEDGEDVDFEKPDDTSLVVPPPGHSQTPQPTESGPTEESEPTEPASTDPTPPPTTSPAGPEPTESLEPGPSPSTAVPTEPSSPTITPSTPATPQPPDASRPSTPYAPPSPAPSPTPSATTSPSNDHQAADTERPGPREIRPLAESPRYLLPQILGLQSQRDSPLVMPGPRDAGERASELETLPPISEDELDAIKAQLASPEHADKTPIGSRFEAVTPQERGSGQGPWRVLSGLTGVLGIAAVLWWVIRRRRRGH